MRLCETLVICHLAFPKPSTGTYVTPGGIGGTYGSNLPGGTVKQLGPRAVNRLITSHSFIRKHVVASVTSQSFQATTSSSHFTGILPFVSSFGQLISSLNSAISVVTSLGCFAISFVSRLYCVFSLIRSFYSVNSRHVTSRHVTSRHVTSRHVTSRHVTSRHVTSRHVTSLHFTSLGYFSLSLSSSITSCGHFNWSHLSLYITSIKYITVNSYFFKSLHCVIQFNQSVYCVSQSVI